VDIIFIRATSMAPRLKRQAWLGISGGIAMYAAIFWLAHHMQQWIMAQRFFSPVAIGVCMMAMLFTSIGFFIWGCRAYALAKGRSPLWGYLGFMHVFGLIILFFLRDLHPERFEESRGFEVLLPPGSQSDQTTVRPET
jgi:hypothetical protein